jgi:hypothetical protein
MNFRDISYKLKEMNEADLGQIRVIKQFPGNKTDN